jgi:hypothetical protein
MGYKQFHLKSVTSLKRGSYSGSNGEIFVDSYKKTCVWLLLKGIRTLNPI